MTKKKPRKQKSEQKQLSTIKLLFLILIVFIIGIGLTFIIYSMIYIKEVQYIKMDIEVKKGMLGFTGDTDYLHFGTIPPGSKSHKNLNISHDYKKPLLVVISFSGEFKDWIIPSENYFILNKDEKRVVRFSVTAPEYAKEKKYYGRIKITFRKPYS